MGVEEGWMEVLLEDGLPDHIMRKEAAMSKCGFMCEWEKREEENTDGRR